mmetsp:Transcript_19535/g.42735  ORF Transcript_19535/g.42735 Transcript_19535/m.42735 type:complete len:189 (-) Transcript_19535:95-661(-)|eukprot:CAMPEP_0170579368 /NCGR_PEP_ID=MMETSP0224-20130122/5948_1 /TAXON_ID=285029 /ORGANISM="Togula jolla, Strain CCCM 725" /LENGTH=188 /DNA_ID=CAMNT_0010902391 /DNA_START=52 /DNA_END=618 /DNA_ORIENTATION=+
MAAFLGSIGYSLAFDYIAASMPVVFDSDSADSAAPVEGGDRLSELAELRRSLPRLNSPATFVELSRAQRRIRVLEKEVAAAAAAPEPRKAARALSPLSRLQGAPLQVLKMLGFILFWQLLLAGVSAPAVDRGIVWPLASFLGRAEADSDLLRIGPVIVFLLTTVAIARVRRELTYWLRGLRGLRDKES